MSVAKVNIYKKDGKTLKTKEELEKEIGKGPNKKWWYFKFRYKDILGRKKQIKKYYATKKEAEEKELYWKIKLSVKKENLNISTINDMHLNLLNDPENMNRESTFYGYESHYKCHIKPFFDNGEYIVKEYTFEVSKKFHQHMKEKTYIKDGKQQLYSLSFLNKLHSDLSLILDEAVKENLIPYNYEKQYGKFKERNDEVVENPMIQYQTTQEYLEFENVVNDLYWKSFWNFCYWHGPRKGEQQALFWKDMLFLHNLPNVQNIYDLLDDPNTLWKVKIYKTLSVKVRKDCKNYLICPITGAKYKITNTKNCKRREIEIAEHTRKLLLDLYNFYSKLPGFNLEWFVWGGLRFTPQTSIDRYLYNYYDVLEKNKGKIILKLSHHKFGRHSHATLLLALGWSFDQIAQRLGDTSRVIEETYAHLIENNLRQTSLMDTLSLDNINKNVQVIDIMNSNSNHNIGSKSVQNNTISNENPAITGRIN